MLQLCKNVIKTARIKETNFGYRPSENVNRVYRSMTMRQKNKLRRNNQNNSTMTLQVIKKFTSKMSRFVKSCFL